MDPVLVTVEPARVEPATVEPMTLEPPTLRLDLCLAIFSEIEDITDGERDLTEPPCEERIEILCSRSSAGDLVLALSSWRLEIDRSGVLMPTDD
jgi:hypothetical protein